MEDLPVLVGGEVQPERTFRRLAEELSNRFVRNDRGERVPYSSFLQLEKKQGLNEIDR
jgi:HAE1 family hydrophobic/amphiphilic exporter-1